MIPHGFEAGPAAEADVEEATALVNSGNRFHLGDAAVIESEEETLDHWGRIDVARDTLALREVDGGSLAALAVLTPRRPVLWLEGYVHHDLTGRGLGTALARWGEGELSRHGFDAVRAGILSVDGAAQRLFRARGYEHVRSYVDMRVDLGGPPPAPEWPDGCSLSGLEPGGEDVFFAVVDGAFAGSWGRAERTKEEWLRLVRTQHPDPSLWFLVRVDGEPAAAAVCSQRTGMGWIGRLGVLPAWRRRGIARALLLHSFGELYARGERRIGLDVDSASETRATDLYESVGMRVTSRFDALDRAAS